MKNEFYLVGDSNSAVIGRAAKRRGVSFVGRSCAPGRLFDSDFFEVEGGCIVMPPFEDPTCYAGLLDYDGPILSTLGFNTQFIAMTVDSDYRRNRLKTKNLSAAVIEALVDSWKVHALRFYDLLLQADKAVWFVHSPQRYPRVYFELAMRLEAVLIRRLVDMGAHFVDVRDLTTDENGVLRRPLFSTIPNDKTHGSIEWGDIVLKTFLEKADIAPQGAV